MLNTNYWIEKHRGLLRFAAYQWGLAMAAALIVTWLARLLIGQPPHGFAEWPPNARTAVSGLVGGGHQLAFTGWFAFCLQAIAWISDPRIRRLAWVAGSVLIATSAVSGIVQAATGLHGLGTLQEEGVAKVVSVAAIAVLVPLALGALPPLGLLSAEHLETFPAWRRLFKTGMAPNGGWMPRLKMKEYARPMPKNEPGEQQQTAPRR